MSKTINGKLLYCFLTAHILDGHNINTFVSTSHWEELCRKNMLYMRHAGDNAKVDKIL